LPKISKLNDNWGRIIGGKRAYKINEKSFREGRRLGSFPIHTPKFDINMPLTQELSEFIGAFIGDGSVNKYNNNYQMEISGDKILDFSYHNSHLSRIAKNVFGIKPKIYISPGGLRSRIYSKDIFLLLTKRFNFPAGVKSYTVKIPDEILSSSFLKHTLRGMFDTDGGVGFDNRKTYKVPYVRINYTSVSKNLIAQIDSLLSKFGIPHSVHSKCTAQMVQINGVENVKKFISEIGFSNKRHLDKLKHLIAS
jgi:DNA-binding transcriptional regulator WhiA